jgi:2-oxoglutarate dehydrogenase E2 component (dihydrolipoamide succinyltransferase)
MAVEIQVPQLGESVTEAVVSKWNKKEGDPLRVDEPLVVLETDKVTIDVPAPVGGTLTQIARKEGDRVKVGEILGAIAPASAAATTAPESAPATVERQTPPQAPQPSATVPPPLPPSARSPATTRPPEVASSGDGRGALVTPVARRVMEGHSLDPSQVRGSGSGGRILKDDVLQLLEGGEERVRKAPPLERPTGPRPKAEREERVKMTPLRRRVAERLLAAQSNAAILTTFNEIDMAAVSAVRKAYQDKFVEKYGVKLGMMSFFVRAAIDALKMFPEVNAEIDGDEVVFKYYYEIGVAVSGSRGLVVPVLRDADRLSMAEIEKQIAELANRARTDKLTLDDLKGGTFTITNGGVFGSLLSTPILNPPQSAILGMHNILERPVARGGQVVIRPMMYVALSYDHRLIDGKEAVQFLVRIKECIEDPERLLLGV